MTGNGGLAAKWLRDFFSFATQESCFSSCLMQRAKDHGAIVADR